MSTAREFNLISIDDYLAGELVANVKHEYVAGVIYAMVGATNAHNIIATNLLSLAGNQLTNSPCREFNSDTKVRINTQSGTRFYYPDAQIVCQPNPQSDTFQDTPTVIFEVLSDSTRRTDEGEKKDSYLSIPSLSAYVMIEQETRASVVFRRIGNGFERLVFDKPDSIIQLYDPNIELPFDGIYRDVEFLE